jgi:hypothetical protein
MQSVSARTWWDHFLVEIQPPDRSAPLKEASLAENLKLWTELTTTAVVRTCEAVGWEATARGHRLNRLPESASEYLAIDAMAFPNRESCDVRWPKPVAVFELENRRSNDRVGYSLWKVLCVDAPLRIVFAYRKDWDEARDLMDYLANNVVASLSPAQLQALDGETAVVTGSRGESETFPHGYFKFWLLDTNLGKFDRL